MSNSASNASLEDTDSLSQSLNPRLIHIPSAKHQKEAHTARIYCLRTTPNFLVSGSADRSVRIWSKQTRRLAIPPLTGHLGSVTAIEVSERRGLILSGDTQGQILVWNLKTGKLLQTINAHHDTVLSMVSDGNVVVSASKDMRAKIWEFRPTYDGKGGLMVGLRFALRGHEMPVLGVCMSGNRVFTSSKDSVKIWDVELGECLNTFKNLAPMLRLEVYQGWDGLRMVGACSDGNIRVYDLGKERELACLEGHDSVVRSVKVLHEPAVDGMKVEDAPGSMAGPKIISASYDGTVRVWSRTKEQPDRRVCVQVFSFSDAVLTPLAEAEQKSVDEDFVNIEKPENRAMDLQVDGRCIYCCGEGAEIVGWEF